MIYYVEDYYSGEIDRFYSFHQMLNQNMFLGFKKTAYEQVTHYYLMVTRGSARGLAVNGNGTWSRNQEKETEGYYRFNSELELLAWIAYGNRKTKEYSV